MGAPLAGAHDQSNARSVAGAWPTVGEGRYVGVVVVGKGGSGRVADFVPSGGGGDGVVVLEVLLQPGGLEEGECGSVELGSNVVNFQQVPSSFHLLM